MTDDDMDERTRALLDASDKLDEEMRATPSFTQLSKVLRRTRQLTYLMAVVLVAVTFIAFRADRNTREIGQTNTEVNRTQAAIKVYCDQTNRDNEEARAKFIEKFAATAPAGQEQQFADFVDVLFPHRDCTAVTTTTVTP